MTPRALNTELQQIPGVGPSIAQDLLDLGIRRIDDLRGADAQDLYDRLCLLRRTSVDRCVLYVFRCAVYFASNERHDPALLQWWKWKDARRHRSHRSPHDSYRDRT